MEANHEAGEPQVKAPCEESEIGLFTWNSLPQPLNLPIGHLLEGKTYLSQTTESKIGAAIETSPILPGAGAEALRPDPSTPNVKHVRGLRPDVSESVGG
jgi:hypothetical protein